MRGPWRRLADWCVPDKALHVQDGPYTLFGYVVYLEMQNLHRALRRQLGHPLWGRLDDIKPTVITHADVLAADEYPRWKRQP